MKLRPYPKYKPSGVEWLGDVPEHWEVKRLRWVGEAIIGLTYSPTDVVSEGEGTLVLRSSNIQRGRIVLDDNVFVSAEIPQKLRTKANDIVICTRNGSRDLVGKTGKISERESGLTFGAFTAVFRSPANGYMFYVFNSGLFSFQAGLYQTSTIFQLTNGTINAFQIPLPPPAEQRAIAAFLDRETGRIDRLVAKKRELIERLKEKRTALISRTVTRGLPPAAARAAGLPENPPLKPSALDWLSDIPRHWEVAPLFRIVETIQTGPFGSQLHSADYVEGGIPLINPAHITASRLVPDEMSSVDESTAVRLSRHRLREGDIIMARRGEIGRCGVVGPQEEGWLCGTGSLVIRLRDCNASYFSTVFPGAGFSGLLELHAVGTTMLNLNPTIVGRMLVPVPPLPEQAAIAAYLDEETAKLDALVGKVEEAVERLQEYRTALITAAVTGKIDVRANSKPATLAP
jgi:type I restriction enzyme, S subunit